MDAAVRKAIARIDIIDEGRTVSRGTGSLVSERLVLTALHVVADRHSSPPAPLRGTIQLVFPDHTTGAVIRDGGYDAQADWALLECAEPPRVRPIPLGEVNESKGGFETFGFPEIKPDGIVQDGKIVDHAAELFGSRVLQLFSEQAAAADGAPVQGSSGSPVLVDDALVGVLRAALINPEGVTRAGTLFACPLDSVLERCGDLLPVPDPCRGLPGLRRRPLPARPFTYLNQFTAADAEIFFGRNRELRQLYGRLTRDDAAPLVLLYGQAGVGKSSFLDAAVLPRLEWTHEVRYARCQRHERLLQTLVRAVSTHSDSSPGDLQSEWRRLEQQSGRPVVAILDQVEEIYVQAESRRGELAELISALAPLFANRQMLTQSRVILSFRKEWFPEIQKALEEAALSYGKVFLDRLDRESVIEVVAGLTSTRRLREHYGLQIEPRLPVLVADDLQEDRDSPIAPTLRIVLSKMWEQATSVSRNAPVFSVENYQQLRRQGILLGDFLDQQISGLANERAADVASGLVIDVLAFHTSPLLTAQQRSEAELAARYRHRARELAGLVQEMKRQWLLVDPASDADANARATRLSHDTLAPLVRQRFDDSDLPGQRARRVVEARTDWRGGRDGVPLDAADLGIVEGGLEGMRALDDSEARLIAASRQRRDKEQGWRRARVALGVVLVLLLAAAGAISSLNYLRAERERRQAVSAAGLVQAREALESDPALAAQILAELKGYPEPADGSRTAYLTLNHPIPVAILRGHDGPIRTVAVSSDDRFVLTTSEDKTARIWRVDHTADPIPLDHRLENESANDPNWVLGGIYSRKGSIATFAQDYRARLWSADGKPIATLSHEDAVDGAAFNQSGTLLLTTTDRGSDVFVWDAESGQKLHTLPHSRGTRVTAAAFSSSPGAQQVFTVAGGQVRVWTLRDREPALERLVQTPENVVASLSPDGAWIAVGERSGRLAMMPAAGTGDSINLRMPGPEPIRNVQFSSDGRMVAVSLNTVVELWDSSGHGSRRLDDPGLGMVRRVAFSDDGRFIAAASEDGVWLWPRTHTNALVGPPTELKGHARRVESIDFTSDGQFVVTGSSEGTARIWRTAPLEPQVIGQVQPTELAAFAPGGAYAVIGSPQERRLSLWQLTGEKTAELASIPLPTEPITQLRVSRDGSHILAVLATQQMRVWRHDAKTRQLEPLLDEARVASAAFDSTGFGINAVPITGEKIRQWRGGTAWADAPNVLLGREMQVGWSLDGSRLLTKSSPGARIAVGSVNDRKWIDLGAAARNQEVVFDAQGSRVVADTVGGIYVWKLSQGQAEDKPIGALLPKAGDTAQFAAFNHDGSRVVILDVRKVARVFSSDGTGSPIELAGRFQAVSFDDDSSHVIGVMDDGRILRRRIGWETMIDALDRATTACLTPGQRTQFFAESADVAQAASLACQERKRQR